MGECYSSAGMDDFKHYRPPSCSSPQNSIRNGRNYHVFLSFRGQDVRKNFVNHLFQALSTVGLLVFLDSEKIGKGNNIELSLGEAIKASTVFIPIFSFGYASSAWCLRELSLMLKCKDTCAGSNIIPLFYDVEPWQVRQPDNEKSPYAEAFKKHIENKRQSKEEIEEWKKALYEVSCLPGWFLETASGYEARFTKQVVMDLLQTFHIKRLTVASYPVGLTVPTEDLYKLLKMDCNQRTRIVGIYGMPGGGKTTLSKAIYNKIHDIFTASCFLFEVRATIEESVMGIRNLQRQIIKDLVGVDVEINSIDQGKKEMKKCLASVRALVILDDVGNRNQFDALVGDWYGAGSRIIINTRDQEVLNSREVDGMYRMKLLDYHEGKELFCWHAFLTSSPHKGFEDVTSKIVEACYGLPLSLKIVGEHLNNERDLNFWSESLTILKDFEFSDLYECFKISYDSLSDQEKQMFLDIAIYISRSPNKQNKESYVKFWKCFGFKAVDTSLEKLEKKSLIVIDKSCPNNYHFEMHTHMMDFGRRIVRKESLFYWIQSSAHRFWRSFIAMIER